MLDNAYNLLSFSTQNLSLSLEHTPHPHTYTLNHNSQLYIPLKDPLTLGYNSFFQDSADKYPKPYSRDLFTYRRHHSVLSICFQSHTNEVVPENQQLDDCAERNLETSIDRFYQLQQVSSNLPDVRFLVVSCHYFHDLKTTIISFIVLSVPPMSSNPTHLPTLSLSCSFVGVKISPSKSTKVVFQLFTERRYEKLPLGPDGSE